MQRIKQVCDAQGLPEAKNQESGDFVDVEHYRPIAVDLHPQKPDFIHLANDYERLRTIANDYERLTRHQQRVIMALLDCQQVSRSDVMKILDVKQTKAYGVLTELLELGLITQQSQGRATVYVLVKKERAK